MDKKDVKSYERNKKKLKYVLGHKELNTVLSKNSQETVGKAFEIMKIQMDSLVKSEKDIKEATGKEKSRVKEALNLLLDIVINTSMRPVLKDLGIEFTLLAFNWNEVYGKRPDIKKICRTIRSVVERTLSLIETIDVVKALTNRIRDVEKFAPPALRLADHYLKSIEDETK